VKQIVQIVHKSHVQQDKHVVVVFVAILQIIIVVMVYVLQKMMQTVLVAEYHVQQD
jgi:hypothetical protein